MEMAGDRRIWRNSVDLIMQKRKERENALNVRVFTDVAGVLGPRPQGAGDL